MSLAAVAFVFLLTASISFVQLTFKFQHQKVEELHQIVSRHYQQQTLSELETWLPPMLEAFQASHFEIRHKQNLLYLYQTADINYSLNKRTYQFSIDEIENVHWIITLPQPFSLHQFSWYEYLTLSIGLLAIALFVRFGYGWYSKELEGIETLASRSKYVLDGDLKAATELADAGGKPRLINRALNKLIADLQDAHKERGRFDKFIRSNTFLDPQTEIGNHVFFENRLDALSNHQLMIAHGVMLLIEFEELEADKASLVKYVSDLASAIQHLISDFPDSFIARRQTQQIAVVVPQVSLAEADVLINRLLNNCLAIPVDVLEEDNYLHIGAAFYKGGDETPQLIEEAEMALKAAQLQRNNTWFMYDKGILDSEVAKGSVRWRSFLENSLVAKRFYPLQQPIFDSDDNLLYREIFTRVRDNAHNEIRATLFIPMANKCGLMPQIERQVLTQVMKSLMQNNQMTYCVNLSLDSLTSRAFVRWLKPTLLEHRPLAARLIFEVSEDIIVKNQNNPTLVANLNMLVKMGARLCVDNVGQQVVGTHYIQEYHFDLVKLHRSIVRNIHQRPENQLFVRSLIGGLHRAKVQVMAEGVGSFEEWQTLKILGVSAAQGELFGSAQEAK